MKKAFLFLLSVIVAVSGYETRAQGTMWGVTESGGTSGGGTLFKANFDGTGLIKVKDFVMDVPGNNPVSRLALGPGPTLNGKLYGYATVGGTYNDGLIFQYDPTTNAYTKVYDFEQASSGANPQGTLILYGTKFYGVTTQGGSDGSGTLFGFDPATNTLTKEADFQSTSTGATPSGYLTLYNNKFYGTTSKGGANNLGTIFEFDPAATGLNLVNKYNFNGTNGGTPLGELTVSGSLIYGIASVGGANNVGALFEFDPAASAGSNYVNKVDFDAVASGSTPRTGLALVSGKMYGTTSAGGANSVGTVYAYVPGATSISKMEDITGNYTSYGSGTLLYANNLLYGSTPAYMFTYDPTQPAGSGFSDAFDYDYYNTAQDIQGGFMVGPSGKIYGLAWSGGLAQAGAIFEYDPGSPIGPSNSNPRGRIYFNTSSGSFSPADLLYLNGKLYGHTFIGGENRGTLFEYNPSNGAFVDTGFGNIAPGSFPSSPVAINGKLYGVIAQTVYEYDPITHTITDKSVNTGGFGVQGFAAAGNGLLYGIATDGGANNTGMIIEYDPTGNTVTKKLDFESTYNGNAVSTFSLASNGLLYAVYQNGGSNAKGYLIEYTPGASTVSKKYEFNTGASSYDSWELITCTANGKLYGTRTNGGTNGKGSILEYTLPTSAMPDGVIKEVYSFPSSGTSQPWGVLVESGNGKLYGSTNQGGLNGAGTFFEYDPIQNSYAEKTSFVVIDGYNQGGLLIIPDPQSITFNAPSPAPYGSALKPATASSGLPMQYTSSNTNVATTQGDSILVVGVGTASITASQPGNGGYLAATPVQQTLTSIKADQTITFSSLSNKKLIDASFTLSATTSSTLAVTYVSSNPTVASISGNTVTILDHGSTDIQASQAGNGNYNAAAPVTQTLTIVNTVPTVANAIAQQTAVQLTPFTFTFANTVFADADGDALTYTVTKYDGSNLPAWLTFDGTSRTFSGTPGVNDTTATIRLTANDGFSGTVNTSFKIHVKAVQTITFSALSNKKLNDVPFALNATASSSLAVAYSSSNPTVASISGNTVTIHTRGSTDIQASQIGNDSYAAAATVTQTLTIVNTAPTVANAIAEQEALQLTLFTFTFADNVFADADGDALTYTATKYDGSNLPAWLAFNATTRTFSGTPGVNDTTATIRLTANDGFSGTVNTLFKIRVKIITGIEPDVNELVRIYPNPVHHTLSIENESGEILPVIIRSSLGEVIYQNEQSMQHDVNVLPWAAGLYFVEVRRGDFVTQTKIVKY